MLVSPYLNIKESLVMPPIFINTTELSKADIDAKKKIFTASKAGAASKEVEDLMKKTVVDALVNNAKFTTNKYKDAKGYTLKMEITEVTVDSAGNTACKMSTDNRAVPRRQRSQRRRETAMQS
jgi:hypothetical protein